MSKAIVIVGYGPGISAAVAEKFGAGGFSVGLIARRRERLDAGVQALEARGVKAAASTADAGDPIALRGAMRRLRSELGPVTVLHWNAYASGEGGDLLTVDPRKITMAFDVALVGLLSAVQEALDDLKAAGDGAVLATNGAFGDLLPAMDAFAIRQKATGLALANAAKAKLVGLLAERLKPDGVYVGEVTVAGVVERTGWGDGGGIEPSAIAEVFWNLFKGRGRIRDRVA